jgi:hypothetical protein
MRRRECSDSLVQLRVNNSRDRSMRTRERIGIRSTEENKRSACEESTCEWMIFFMCKSGTVL